MKINIDEIMVVKSFLDTVSTLEYETISDNISKLDDETALITILQTTKEDKNIIHMLLKEEVRILEGMLEGKNDDAKSTKNTFEVDSILENCVIFSKLSSIFSNQTSLSNIMVFNSSINALPEQKALEYYNKELVDVRDFVQEECKDFISNYRETKREDSNFEILKKISYALTDTSIKLNRVSKKAMSSSAQDFLATRTVEEQMDFFRNLFNSNVSFKNSGEPLQIKTRHDSNTNEDIIEAEIENSERVSSQKNIEKILEEHFLKTQQKLKDSLEGQNIQENITRIESITERVNDILRILEIEKNKETINSNEEIKEETYNTLKNIETITDSRINAIEEKLEEALERVNFVFSTFNDFIENQTKMTKIIKEKYAIE